MKSSYIIIGGLLLLLAILLGVRFWPTPTQNQRSNVETLARSLIAQTAPSQSSQPVPIIAAISREHGEKQKRKIAIDNIVSALNASISFYGKVVDQNGEPVPDAEVIYNAADKFMASGSSYNGKSDVKGFFSITGIHGFRLSVAVRKEGYYFIYKKSNLDFAYGTGPDGVFLEPPTKDNPAVFVLKKMGESEALIKIENYVRVQRNGSPTQINLQTGQSTGQGDLKVESWTEDKNTPQGQPYYWKCRVSIPGGGLVERNGQFDFEAPKEGYRAADEIVMLQTTKRWQSQARRDYFLKLADNRYARIEFEMIAGGDNFFSFTSYLNPKPGHRNLEYDPAKKITLP